MARARLPPGSHGAISYQVTANGSTLARTRLVLPGGQVRQVSATGATEDAARRALLAKCADPARHPVPAGTPATLADLLERRLELNPPPSPQSVAEYRRCHRTVICARRVGGTDPSPIYEPRVVPGLGEVASWRPGLVSTPAVQALLDQLAAEGRSVKLARTLLGAAFKVAVSRGWVPVNPVREVVVARRARHRPTVLSDADLAAVRAALVTMREASRPGPKESDDLGDVLTVIAATGCRIGEALALRWSDLDLDATPATIVVCGTVRERKTGETWPAGAPSVVRQPWRKGHGSDRAGLVVPLPDFAVAMLRRRATGARSGLIFPAAGRVDVPLRPTNVRRKVHRLREIAGVEHLTPHAIRRTVATRVAAADGTRAATGLLGHSAEAITEAHYIARASLAPDVRDVLAVLDLASPGIG